MTTNKKFKKLVRERMAQTGENYTQARRKLLEPGDVLECVCHDLVPQGANNEELCCTRCSFSKPNVHR